MVRRSESDIRGIVAGMKRRPTRAEDARAALIARIGAEIVRFQDASNDVDDAAAAVLALERGDLRCISVLLFSGPASIAQLEAALQLPARALRATVERIELAGYARRARIGGDERVVLTDHARRWIETLWGPLAMEGARLLDGESTRDLGTMARIMERIGPVHEAHARRIRALLDVPATRARSNRQRGGLSPAALRRVQLFVEASLDRQVRLSDLAERAGLSEFHFARAFRTTTGTTPRAFVESRRVERAKTLLRSSSLSLAQIASEVGLGTQSRFTTTFRRATGLTPAVYRRGAP